MQEIDVEHLINMNYRVLTLLGIATAIIGDYKDLDAFHDKSHKCDWFMQAVENVVYLNKPIPPMP